MQLRAACLAAGVAHWNVWLRRPGLAVNYCNTDLSTTVFWPDGTNTTIKIDDAKTPIDCFYVYPTVSLERRGNADLKIQNEETTTAIAQAARFSQVCRVFAPVYRQTTVYHDAGNLHGNGELAYADVLAAWRDYLAHWNGGRGVVLIGHSQGAGVLEQLLQVQHASMHVGRAAGALHRSLRASRKPLVAADHADSARRRPAPERPADPLAVDGTARCRRQHRARCPDHTHPQRNRLVPRSPLMLRRTVLV
jgi:hypothetical protein